MQRRQTADSRQIMAVTEFMLGTCLGLRHQLNVDNTGAWHYAAVIVDSSSTDDQVDEIACIPLLTGSVAEFLGSTP